MSTNKKDDNMVTPVKKPLNKKPNANRGKRTNTKKKVVSSTTVNSPIVKNTTKKEVVPKKIMKTSGTSSPKPISEVELPKVAKPNAVTNKNKSTVAKSVNKNTANAVKASTKAVKGAKAVKSTTKGVTSAATLNASTKKGTTGTNVSKAKNTKTKGVAKAAATVNKADLPKVKQTPKVQPQKPKVQPKVQPKVEPKVEPKVVSEDLNKEIDKYISNSNIPSVSTTSEDTQRIEDVVDKDFSLTSEYKNLAKEVKEAALKEQEEKRKELENKITDEDVAKIEKDIEKEVSKPKVTQTPVQKVEPKVEPKEDISSYQDYEEAKKDETFNTQVIRLKKAKEKKNKQKHLVLRIINIVFALALLISSSVFGITAVTSNYLPNKYIYIIIGVLIVLNLFVIFLLKKKHKIFNFMGIFLSVLFSAVFIVGFIYMRNTFNVIKDLLKEQEVVTPYYYVVLSDSEYEKPEDLAGLNVGLLEKDADAVMDEVSKSILVEFKKYAIAGDLVYSLQLHETEGVLMSTTIYDLMKEMDKEFESEVKVIGTIEVRGIEESESSIEPNESFIVYISGLDTRDASYVAATGLSDVNMIAVVNPKVHKILLVNIPRDYYVQLHGTDGLRDKLTHAGLYGIDMSIKTIEDLFSIKINAYVKVNFNTVTTLVDDLDGIDVYSDISFNSSHINGWVVPKGNVHMNGKQALAFARERYAYQSGDRHRGENQQAVMTAIIKKVSTNKKYLLQYDKILADITEYVSTNVKEENIQALVKDQLDTMPSWEIESISVNGSNANNFTYSWPTQYTYVMLPDQNTVDNAKAKISEVLKS